MLGQVWWRALAALAVSFAASWLLHTREPGILPLLVSSGAGLASGLVVAAMVCLVRSWGRSRETAVQRPIYRLLQGI